MSQNNGNARTAQAESDADLTEEEMKELSRLKDPDTADARHRDKPLNDDRLEALLAAGNVQDEDFARHSKGIGLKPACFVVEAYQIAVRNAQQAIEKHGRLPSKQFLLGLCAEEMRGRPEESQRNYLDVIECLFDPIDWARDRTGLEHKARQQAQRQAIREFIGKSLNATNQGKFNFAKARADLAAAEKIGGDTKDAGRRGFRLKELYSLPTPAWLIDKHFPSGGTVCLYGPSGKGKTFVGIEWAMCLATARPAFNTFPVHQTPVLYIISEGQQGFKLRCQAWEKFHQVETPDNFVVIPSSFNFQDQAEADEILRIARDSLGYNPGIVFVDTLARNFGNGDEDKAKDMNAYIRNVDWLREATGATIVSVHHTGKDAARKERGSSVLRSACDSSIEVSMKGNGSDSQIIVSCEKQKDAAPFEDYTLVPTRVELTPYLDSLVWTMQTKEQAAEAETIEQMVLHQLNSVASADADESNTMTTKQVSDAVGKDPGEVNKVLKILAESSAKTGVCRRRFGKGATAPFHYWKDDAVKVLLGSVS